jgi:uncharacterized protein
MSAAATDSFTASTSTDDWQPFMLDGVEVGKFHAVHAAEDGSYISAFWRVLEDDNGEFDYVPPATKTVYTIEGSIKVTVEGGETTELSAGDSITLPKGAVTNWEVTQRPYMEIFIVGG